MLKLIFLVLATAAYFGFQFWYTLYRKKNHVKTKAKYIMAYDPETGNIEARGHTEDKGYIYSYTFEGRQYMRREHNAIITKKYKHGKYVDIYVNPKFPLMFMSETRYRYNIVSIPIAAIIVIALEIMIILPRIVG